MIRFIALSLCCTAMLLPVGCIPPSGDDDVKAAARLSENGEFAKAAERLEQALSKPLKEVTKSDVYALIGYCHSELKEYKTAVEYFDKAIAEDPKNYRAHMNKGLAYGRLRDYDNAEKSYNAALDIAPDYPELHANMGLFCLNQRKYGEAVDHLEKYVKLDGSAASPRANLALAYAHLGRFKEADDSLQKAVDRGYTQADVFRKRIKELKEVSRNK